MAQRAHHLYPGDGTQRGSQLIAIGVGAVVDVETVLGCATHRSLRGDIQFVDQNHQPIVGALIGHDDETVGPLVGNDLGDGHSPSTGSPGGPGCGLGGAGGGAPGWRFWPVPNWRTGMISAIRPAMSTADVFLMRIIQILSRLAEGVSNCLMMDTRRSMFPLYR